MRKTGILIITILNIFLMGGCGSAAKMAMADQPEYVLTYAENQPENYPTTQGANKFAELVYERTGGRIKILIYSGGELGDEISVMEQLQYGGIDFGRISIMTLGEVQPKLNLLQLPYLYENAEHMWKVLDGEIGVEFMGSLQGTGIVGLSWYDAGSRNFYTTDKQVSCLEDLQGLRIRVAESAFMEEMVKALGAQPVPIAYSEVYSALETGMIDGAENNWPSYEFMEHHKVARYMLLDEHNRIPEMQIVSEATWNKLSEEDRNIVLACAKESAEYERSLWKELELKAMQEAEAQGCIITRLSEEEMQLFRSAVAEIYQKQSDTYGDIIREIQETGR